MKMKRIMKKKKRLIDVRHLRMLKRAETEAERSTYEPYRIGACVARGSCVLSVGHNQIRFRGKGQRFTNYPESYHAERVACSRLSKESLQGTTLYIFRKRKDGSSGYSKPCKHCMQLIQSVGIKRVVYSTETGFEELKV